MPKTDDFAATFATLRKVLKPYEKVYAVTADKPDSYYLSSKTTKTKSGHPICFAGVGIAENTKIFLRGLGG